MTDAISKNMHPTCITRKGLTPIAARLSEVNIVIDKLHFKGHVDKWCHEHCNPYKFEELNQVCGFIMQLSATWYHALEFCLLNLQVDTEI